MRQTERVTVTMLGDHAEAVRELVDAGQADSVSSYVAGAVAHQLARDAALAQLRERFGQPPAEALAWARRTLGVEPAAVSRPDIGRPEDIGRACREGRCGHADHARTAA